MVGCNRAQRQGTPDEAGALARDASLRQGPVFCSLHQSILLLFLDLSEALCGHRHRLRSVEKQASINDPHAD